MARITKYTKHSPSLCPSLMFVPLKFSHQTPNARWDIPAESSAIYVDAGRWFLSVPLWAGTWAGSAEAKQCHNLVKTQPSIYGSMWYCAWIKMQHTKTKGCGNLSHLEGLADSGLPHVWPSIACGFPHGLKLCLEHPVKLRLSSLDRSTTQPLSGANLPCHYGAGLR